MSGRNPIRCPWLLLALLAVPGCGAGLITGAVNSGGGGTAGLPPSLSLPGQEFPLAPSPAGTGRTVVIANAQLPQTANLQVQLRVHETTDPASPVALAEDQASPTVSAQGGSTVVGFELRTDAIATRFGVDLDVRAQLAVMVDGRDLAPSVPVTLLARMALRLFDGEPLFLSPLGSKIRLAARGVRSADAAGIQVSVTTVDPTGVAPVVTRLCLRPAFETPQAADPPLLAGERLVTAEFPGNTFSGPAQFVVDDTLAGRSPPVSGAYYRPDITVALPAQGSTRGGTEVTLFGPALAPLVAGVVPGVPDFDQVEILLRKGDAANGERIVQLAPEGLHRPESSLDRLVFTMPSSPDGRPGNVGIILRNHLRPTVTAEVVAEGVFLYANPEPAFGPRGTVLAGDPIAVAPIALEGAPHSTQATDVGVLYAQGNFAALQLLLSQENGMFIRYYGPSRRIGDPAQPSQRSPRDLVSGDFDSDGVPDLLIVNGGLVANGTNEATHHIVLGQQSPLPPLGDVVTLPTPGNQPLPGGMARARVVDLDRDGADDVVLFPGADADPSQRPIVLLQRSLPGHVVFLAPIEVPVRPYPCDAFEIYDIDGDGLLDVAVCTGGSLPRLDIAYGDGTGHFAAQTARLDLVVPSYTPAAAAPIVGLHAMSAAPCPMALVFAGLPSVGGGPNPVTPPLLVFAQPRAGVPRTYDQPTTNDVVAGAIDPFRASLVVNLDGLEAGRDELIVGGTAESALFAVGVFRIDPVSRHLVFQPNLLPRFAGREVRSLFFGIAFPADPSGQPGEVPGLFVRHEVTVDGQVERRLSTLLVAQPPDSLELLAPDVGFGIGLASVVGGRFTDPATTSGTATRGLALPRSGSILIGDNNGFGALAPGNEMLEPGLVPQTTTRIPGPTGAVETLVFFDDGSRDGRTDGRLRIGTWRPRTDVGSGLGGSTQQTPTSFSGDLRPLLPAALAAAAIDSTSRLQAADVDGDGLVDLCALLRFTNLRREDEAVLMVMRGRTVALETDFPFDLPSAAAVVPVHGSATSFALGDFVPDSVTAPVRLELALAVPASSTPTSDDGNHVRFYRLVGSGTGLRWQRSFAPAGDRVLVAGNAPTRLAAADFDGNGTIDLLVTADDDSSLRWFLNTGLPASDPDEVAIEAFHEGLGSPLPTQPGRHTNLLLGDINGDGNVDALIATEFTLSNGKLTSSVAFYLSSGTGEFASPTLVSPSRLGDVLDNGNLRDSRLAVDLGDINSDGVPDLLVGWPQQSGGLDNNLRVLLGGSR